MTFQLSAPRYDIGLSLVTIMKVDLKYFEQITIRSGE
jgi:hypothetical protein